ncbi:MAG: NAD-dependent epimerase/dehydratase family protein [Chloroflexi bacterium]|nr:NAD-dependent epimerase/dehydratase family protein [Chloroflexota bacterium]
MSPAEVSWDGARVLVTGARGFIGKHLITSLEAAGASVIAADRGGDADVKLDLRDGDTIHAALQTTQPSVVINLAAIADPRQAEADPLAAYDVNVLGQLRIILSLRELAPKARLIVVGSALQYGRDGHDRPVLEDDPQRPEGVYATTKAAADVQAAQHHRSDGLNIVRVRLFNVIGPGRPEEYFPAPQIRQAAEILDRGAPPAIRTLSLRDTLDFVDVRDAADAIQAAAARGRTGAAYNVASGQATPLRAVVDRLIEIAGIQAEVHQGGSNAAAQGRVVVGDPSLIARDTGWRVRRTLDNSLRDGLREVRERLASSVPIVA